MANVADHGLIGGAVGAGTYLVLCRYFQRQADLGEFLVCAAAGCMGAVMPDLLEPAVHPHHRQIAHSVTVGGLLTKCGIDVCTPENCTWDEFHKILLACAIAGYVSHLAIDGCTPRGLPLLGK